MRRRRQRRLAGLEKLETRTLLCASACAKVLQGELVVRGSGIYDSVNVDVSPGNTTVRLNGVDYPITEPFDEIDIMTFGGLDTVLVDAVQPGLTVTVRSGAQPDFVRVKAIAPTVYAGHGNDDVHVILGGTIFGNAGDDLLQGALSFVNSSLVGGSGNDTLIGGPLDDTLQSGSGSDSIVGMSGNDLINGGSGADTLHGNDGNDTMNGSSGEDLLWGGDGSDTLRGGSDKDTLRGEQGDDNLAGNGDDDIVVGGSGNDVLGGSAGNDVVIGGFGRDTINGNGGDDILIAGLSSYESDNTALTSLRETWTSTAGPVTTKAVAVQASSTPLNRTTVMDDPDLFNPQGAEDKLRGSGGLDWVFFVTATDQLLDSPELEFRL